MKNVQPIPGFPDYYADTPFGVIYSLKRGRLKPLRPSISNTGYQIVGLRVAGRRIYRTVHFLVALTAYGGRPPETQVNHKNGIKTDNRAENLEHVTPEANRVHARQNGLVPGRYGPVDCRGEKNNHARLTWAMVDAIRAALASGVMRRAVRERFRISDTHLRDILSGRRWPESSRP